MHALKRPKHLTGAAFLVASALVAAGVWVSYHNPGKNGMDSIPLFWLFVLVSAPVLSLVCVVALWRQKASAWVVVLATLLLLPQCHAWYFAVITVLYYSGVVRR